jgi:hypothetical protein
VVERTGHWLATGIERLVAERRSRIGNWLTHWIFEALFGALLVTVLVRAGWSFFHGNLWEGRPASGAGFLQEALVWVVLWGLTLRWAVFGLVRRGLDRDIAALVSQVPAARLVDPLLADFQSAAAAATAFCVEGDRLGGEADALAAAVEEPTGLGRLRRGPG